MGRLEYRVLGPLRLLVDGEERPLAGEKLRGLLAVLLVESPRPVSAERLVDDLWGDEPPASARQSLHVHVARLRRALAVDGTHASPLETSPRGYVLDALDGQLDAARFRELIGSARDSRRAGEADAALDGYVAALALWRGAAFEDVSLPTLEPARAELEGLRLAAIEERIELQLGLGRAKELVAELEELVARHPLREGLRAQLMLALYATGRQADALAAYRDAHRALDDLGLAPGPQLRELEAAILRQDPSLPTVGARPREPAERARARSGSWWVAAALVALAALVAGGIALLLRDDPPEAASRAPVRVRPNSLVEIDPATNTVVSTIRVGHAPDSIAFTRNAAWVTTGDRTVDRVDLRTREVRHLGGIPVALATTATLNGDVWVSSFEEPFVTLIARDEHVIGSGGVVASGPPRVRTPGSAEAVAVGGGYLWVTSPRDSGGDNTVSRIDLRSQRLVSSAPVGELPLFLAFGYGSAWVSNYRGNSLSVVRPGSEQPETVAVGEGPLGVAAGAGGIWVVTYWPRELVRVDPETREVVARIGIGEGPLAVAVGGGGVWVTNRNSRTITRVDPSSNRVAATIRLGAAPYGIKFARGRVWVTTQRCGINEPGC